MHCSAALIMPFKCMQTMLLISWVCSLYALSKFIDYVWSFSTETYTSTMGYHVGSKEDLVPPEPVLTRYRKEAGIKAFVKKEILDPRMSEERRSSEINILTTAALCVQLNTLHVSVLTSPLFFFFFFWEKLNVCIILTLPFFISFGWGILFIYCCSSEFLKFMISIVNSEVEILEFNIQFFMPVVSSSHSWRNCFLWRWRHI